jgi:hypothetical protein
VAGSLIAAVISGATVWVYHTYLRRRPAKPKAAADAELAFIRARVVELEGEAAAAAAAKTAATAAATAAAAEATAAEAAATVERAAAEARAGAAVEAAYGRGVLVGIQLRGPSGSLPVDLEGLRMRVPSGGVGPGGRGAFGSPSPGLTNTPVRAGEEEADVDGTHG